MNRVSILLQALIVAAVANAQEEIFPGYLWQDDHTSGNYVYRESWQR